MNCLGEMLYQGIVDIRKNHTKASRLWTRASGKGKVSANRNLGWLLFNGGDSVPKNHIEAVRLYKLAIEEGDVDSMLELGALLSIGGDGFQKSEREAHQLFMQARKQIGNLPETKAKALRKAVNGTTYLMIRGIFLLYGEKCEKMLLEQKLSSDFVTKNTESRLH